MKKEEAWSIWIAVVSLYEKTTGKAMEMPSGICGGTYVNAILKKAKELGI